MCVLYHRLQIDQPVSYHLTGTFQAPSSSWLHEDFPLNDFELILVTDGTLYLTYQNIPYTVSRGDFLLLPPVPAPNNRRFGHQASYCSFYWLHFSCSFSAVVSNDSKEQQTSLQSGTSKPSNTLLLPVSGHLAHPEKAVVLMKQLQDCVRSGYDPVSIDYLSTSILCEIHHQVVQLPMLQLDTSYSKKQLYHDILDFVAMNLTSAIKVSDIAAHFGYNEKYLTHLFSILSGTTLKQQILISKMEAANFLLRDTNQKIGDIALSLGFSDSHTFAKAYRKINDMTPTEYRNAYSKRLLFHT